MSSISNKSLLKINNKIIGLNKRALSIKNSPQNVSVSVLSATSAKLTWTNVGNQGDGIRVYSSTDGINYSQVGSNLPVGTTSYTHNSIDTGSNRYWYVIYFKGTKEGAPSSIVQLDWFTMECTTTGAETLTLTNVDCVAGDGITIFWGDGNSNSYTSTYNGNLKSHTYSGAGTWTVKIANPLNISYIEFRDSKLTNFNTNQFLKCGNNLTGIYLDNLGAGRTINSSDLAHLKLTSTLHLFYYQPGVYNINSQHFQNYTLTNLLYLYFDEIGTYNINSQHFQNYAITDSCVLYFSKSGTYNINSQHFQNYMVSNSLVLHFSQSGTYNINTSHFKNYTVGEYHLFFNTTDLIKTISRNDFATLYRVILYLITMGLTQSEINNILLGIYDAFPLKTNTGGFINLSDSSNAAPSGTYQAACPPTSGKEACYELLNDSCNVSSKHWSTISVVGGLP